MKSGFVAVVGKPNAGKSSLINKLVGEKVAIVSPKPQTTRGKTLGILNEKDMQIVFIDTPGFVKPINKLNEYMIKSIETAQSGVDVVLMVIDGTKKLTQVDVDKLNSYKVPVVIAYNKMDLLSYEKVFPELAKLNKIDNLTVVPISAKTGKNLRELKSELEKHMPEGEAMYPTEEYTDKSVRFIAGEIIREKILWLLNDEVPHGVNVDITLFNEEEKTTFISADIIVERDSHKPIIIGKGGAMLKEIGTKSRLAIAKLLGTKVHLELFVKVRENWRNDENLLRSFGYNKKNI